MYLYVKDAIQKLEQTLKEFLTNRLVAENAKKENLEQLKRSKNHIN